MIILYDNDQKSIHQYNLGFVYVFCLLSIVSFLFTVS
jgi:hypothetical protein